MTERLAIELPDDLSQAQQDELIASLRQIDEVEEAENLGPSRGVDLQTISIGIQLATQIAGLIGPAVKKIIACGRSWGIITFAAFAGVRSASNVSLSH